MDEVDPFPVGYISPSGLLYLGEGRWQVPPPAIIPLESAHWREVFPDTHGGYWDTKPDWAIAFAYGDLHGEFDSPRPYILMEYDSLYGKHWHELTIRQVSDLMAVLGSIIQQYHRDAIACDSE